MLYQEKMVVLFKSATVLLKKVAKHRNGYYPKIITISDRKFVVDIPRDREWSFEPKVVKKEVYKITTEEIALDNLEKFEENRILVS